MWNRQHRRETAYKWRHARGCGPVLLQTRTAADARDSVPVTVRPPVIEAAFKVAAPCCGTCTR